jgi:hypothetical protein
MSSITRAPWRSSDRAPSSPFGVPPRSPPSRLSPIFLELAFDRRRVGVLVTEARMKRSAIRATG